MKSWPVPSRVRSAGEDLGPLVKRVLLLHIINMLSRRTLLLSLREKYFEPIITSAFRRPISGLKWHPAIPSQFKFENSSFRQVNLAEKSSSRE